MGSCGTRSEEKAMSYLPAPGGVVSIKVDDLRRGEKAVVDRLFYILKSEMRLQGFPFTPRRVTRKGWKVVRTIDCNNAPPGHPLRKSTVIPMTWEETTTIVFSCVDCPNPRAGAEGDFCQWIFARAETGEWHFVGHSDLHHPMCLHASAGGSPSAGPSSASQGEKEGSSWWYSKGGSGGGGYVEVKKEKEPPTHATVYQMRDRMREQGRIASERERDLLRTQEELNKKVRDLNTQLQIANKTAATSCVDLGEKTAKIGVLEIELQAAREANDLFAAKMADQQNKLEQKYNDLVSTSSQQAEQHAVKLKDAEERLAEKEREFERRKAELQRELEAVRKELDDARKEAEIYAEDKGAEIRRLNERLERPEDHRQLEDMLVQAKSALHQSMEKESILQEALSTSSREILECKEQISAMERDAEVKTLRACSNAFKEVQKATEMAEFLRTKNIELEEKRKNYKRKYQEAIAENAASVAVKEEKK